MKRVVYLFGVMCLALMTLHLWQWALALQERGDLLAEQNRLRIELAQGEARYRGLMQMTTDSCQGTLQEVALRLGLDEHKDSFEVARALNGAKSMRGVGGPKKGGRRAPKR